MTDFLLELSPQQVDGPINPSYFIKFSRVILLVTAL